MNTFTTMQDKLFAAFQSADDGLTRYEAMALTGIKRETVTARVAELIQRGKLIRTGLKRPTATGDLAEVLRVREFWEPRSFTHRRNIHGKQLQRSTKYRTVILDALRHSLGLCDQDLAKAVGVPFHVVASHRNVLVLNKEVRDSGRRKYINGRPNTIWTSL